MMERTDSPALPDGGPPADPFGALIWGAKMGQIPIIEKAIAEGADVNEVDEYGKTPLYYAEDVQGHYDQVMAELAKNGARYEDVVHHSNPWSEAVTRGDGHVASLMAAAHNHDRYQVMMALLEMGPGLTQPQLRGILIWLLESALHHSMCGYNNLWEVLCCYHHDDEIEKKRQDLIKHLMDLILRFGMGIDARFPENGETLLTMAVRYHKNVEFPGASLVTFLVRDRGADATVHNSAGRNAFEILNASGLAFEPATCQCAWRPDHGLTVPARICRRHGRDDYRTNAVHEGATRYESSKRRVLEALQG
ncbi:hypothetical protein B0H67DRAFT_682171 [Lasiosphaeris hirsuta]|uniref:Ankyrin repeat domain-containing protein n=1 Tax=Lasiosphaeris hirsuta TaxID=260670 RepID=A0AA40AQR4_9PEZI|nr:hypothetical protein B0H67DRAFT_682171 [Lasiosphaeris hirsuta]